MSVETDAGNVALALETIEKLKRPNNGSIGFVGDNKKYSWQEFEDEFWPTEEDKRLLAIAGVEQAIISGIYQMIPHLPRQPGSPHIDIKALEDIALMPPDRLKAAMIWLAEKAVKVMFRALD